MSMLLHYDDNLGALLIGQILSTFLYGISTLQAYVYMMRFPRDGPELKCWVFFVWALDTANVILVCHGLYYWAWGLVAGTAMPDVDIQHQMIAKRSFSASAVLNLVVAAAVQCFFTKRIYKLCRTPLARYTLPLTMTLLVLAHLVLGAQTMVKVISTFQSSSLDSLASLAFSTTLPYMILAVASDGYLAGALTLMSRGRSPDCDKSTLNLALHQIVTFLINRCILIAMAAVARLIVFTILPWTAWFIVADFIMGKLYANSFVAWLNARAFMSDEQEFETAMFSSVPDISVMSTDGSVLPAFYASTSRAGTNRTMSRPASLPELVFGKNPTKGGIIATNSLKPTPRAPNGVCPCMLATRP